MASMIASKSIKIVFSAIPITPCGFKMDGIATLSHQRQTRWSVHCALLPRGWSSLGRRRHEPRRGDVTGRNNPRHNICVRHRWHHQVGNSISAIILFSSIARRIILASTRLQRSSITPQLWSDISKGRG